MSPKPAPFSLLSSLALLGCVLVPARSAAAAPGRAPVCQPLVDHLHGQLRGPLHGRLPSFGIRAWSEVAAEAMNHASAPCREAIAAGRAPEVAEALRAIEKRVELGEQAEPADPARLPLRRFVYRLTCQLRVPEAGARVLAGVREPGVYSECADALFAMASPEPDAVALRELYLDGLRREPLSTRLPGSVLRPPYAAQLAPVLVAYDQARLPRRDTIHQAVCGGARPDAAELQAACASPAEREPQWAREKLLRGDVLGGLAHLEVLPPVKTTQFAPLLRQFDSEQRRGRDLLYAMLCKPPSAPAGELAVACRELVPSVELSWPKLNRKRLAEAELNAELKSYYRSGRDLGTLLLSLSLLVIGHALLFRRRARPAAAV
ncbi:MAG: hypothetical protein U1A78_21040 [Polyangia bacterium]